MVRPSKFNKEDAIAFAMNEIWKNGYEATSVKALSEKLGITRSSFYNAFNSREALFEQVLALYASQSPDRAFRTAAPDIPVRTLLTETFRTVCMVRAADKDGRGCLAVNSVSELCNTKSALGPLLEKAMLGNIARIEALLKRGVANGEINPKTDIHTLALSVKTLLVGLNTLSKFVRSEDELWRIASTTLRGLDLLEEGANA